MNKMTMTYYIHWFCRICWKIGHTCITIVPIANELVKPTKEELQQMVKMAILNKCCEAEDLRIHVEGKQIKTRYTNRRIS